MGLPKRVSGSNYVEMWNRLHDAASTANGLDPVEDDPPPEPLTGGFVARLSNGEAAAVLQAWRLAAGRSRYAWPLWYELSIYAFGWRKEGDRFDTSKEHAKAPFPPEMLPLVWAWTARLAEQLDAADTRVYPLAIDTSWSAYATAMKLAWEQMKEERRKQAPAQAPAPANGKGGGFPWWLLLLFMEAS